MKRLISAAAVSVLVATIFPTTTSAAADDRAERIVQPAVRFSKVYFDSPGNDTGSNWSLNAEWARVTNYSSRNRTLTGWTIRDTSGHVYRFGTFTLRAGTSVRLHTGNGTNSRTDLYWDADYYVWNNSGDTAILKNSSGTRIDTCSWTGAGSYKVC